MIKEKYIERIKETTINVTQTKIDSIRQKDIEKTGLRIYKDGYIGYVGTLGKYDEAELEKRAIDGLNNKIPYEYKPEGNFKKEEDFTSEIINKDKLVDEFDELLSIIRKEQPEFYFSNKLYLIDAEFNLQNDNGLDLRYRDRCIILGLIFKEKTSINIMDGFITFEGRHYNRDLVIEDINKTCNAYKNKVELPKEGKLPVIFASDESLPFIKLIQALNGNNFGTESSLLSDKMGKKIFNENFTLYQTNNPNDLIVPFFDKEGVINENYRYALIENGVIKSPYTDKKTAHKYNLPLTGCAGGEYDSMPSLGTPRLKVKESEKTIKELLGGQMGVFVIVTSGGDFTPEGNFGAPVQLAYLFDGEKFIGRLPELNISSNVFEMFGDSFVGVSKDTVNPLSNNRYLVMNMKVSKI